MTYDPNYRFPGMPAFAREAEQEGISPITAAKLNSIWFVSRVSDALSQLGEARPEHRAAMMEEAVKARAGLAAALARVDRAIADVKAHAMPEPETPEPETPEPEASSLAKGKAPAVKPGSLPVIPGATE